MGGNTENMYGNYNSKASDQGVFSEKETENGVKSEESAHSLSGNLLVFIKQNFLVFTILGKCKLEVAGLGLKLAIILQVVLVAFLVFLWSFRCYTRYRRRRSR